MRKLGIFGFSVLCFFASSFIGHAFDFGSAVSNTTGYSIVDEASLIQSNKATLWAKTPGGKQFSFFLQGSYTFDIDRYYLFDIDMLQFEGSFVFLEKTPFKMGFKAGRLPFDEFSKKILYHRLDGIKLSFDLPFVTIAATGGFSGFFQQPTSTIIMSMADYTASLLEDVIFGTPRLIETISATFIEPFLRQDVHITCIFQQDLRDKEDLIQPEVRDYNDDMGGKLHTFYFGVGLSGPLFYGFFWEGYGYFGTGSTLSFIEGLYSYAPIISGLFGIELTWFNRNLLYSRAKAGFTYSSGDADYSRFYEGNTGGIASTFIPISRPGVGLAFSPQLGNIFYPELSYSVKPFSMFDHQLWQNIQLEARGVGCFRSTTGAISESGVDPSSTSLYLGTNIDLSFKMRITSEIGISYSQGFFIPHKQVFPDKPFTAVGRFLLTISL